MKWKTDREEMLLWERPFSGLHPRMSPENRAAQFAPYAALTGFGGFISEEARLTDARRELSDDEIDVLERKLSWLMSILPERPIVTVRHFVPDRYKDGGSYREFTAMVTGIDTVYGQLIFADGTRVLIRDLADVTGDLFREEF